MTIFEHLGFREKLAGRIRYDNEEELITQTAFLAIQLIASNKFCAFNLYLVVSLMNIFHFDTFFKKWSNPGIFQQFLHLGDSLFRLSVPYILSNCSFE